MCTCIAFDGANVLDSLSGTTVSKSAHGHGPFGHIHNTPLVILHSSTCRHTHPHHYLWITPIPAQVIGGDALLLHQTNMSLIHLRAGDKEPLRSRFPTKVQVMYGPFPKAILFPMAQPTRPTRTVTGTELKNQSIQLGWTSPRLALLELHTTLPPKTW